jgi:hypothetical protein
MSNGHAWALQALQGRRLADPNTPPRPVALTPIPEHLRPKATR